MLQKNRKNSLNKCKVFIGAIFFSAFLIINGIGFLIVFIFFLYVLAKKENININSVFKDFGVYDCLKFFFGENFKIKEVLKKYEDKFNKNNKKDELYEKIKKQDFEIEMKKLKEKGNLNKKIKKDSTFLNELKEKLNEKKIEKQGDNKYKIKEKKYDLFKNQKSIWDDYESVLDIMDKNK